MKIVVLDGFALNPGDLSWQEIKRFGDCTIYDRTLPSEILQRAQGAEIILTNKTELDANTLSQLPALKYIGVLATGVNIIDLKAATQQGIIVSNIPSYSDVPGAQMVFAHLLELTHRVGHHSQTVFDQKWSKSLDFSYWDYPLVALDGLTMGIIGYGGIGKRVANAAIAFGMNVLVSTRTVPDVIPEKTDFCSLDELFIQSNVISLHCPLTPATKNMINQVRLEQMKDSAFLINTSRGQLVIEQDLANALNKDVIAGAGLDVLSKEPADPDNPLLKAKNCFITPHMAWATSSARKKIITIASSNIKAYIAGEPANTVKPRAK